jgi:hypothetical protein
MEKGRFPKQKVALIAVSVALIAVSVALIACVAYIAFAEYQKAKTTEALTAYQQGAQDGYQYGYEQAVVQLLQQVSTCQQVPVIYNNQTINVIAVACLQQAQS